MDGAQDLRRRLIAGLEIRDARVRDALLAVPRELFVPEFAAVRGLEAVYRDEVIVTKTDERGLPLSSSSQPGMMAAMLDRLALAPGRRVLEIGTGTGYNAALLKTIVGPRGSVVSVDVDAALARSARAALRRGGYGVRVAAADGRDGWPAGAPYDRIVVTASTGEVPRAWLDQLAEGGLLELPLRLSPTGLQAVATLRRSGERLDSVAVLCGGFIPLRGAEQPRPTTLIASDGGRPLAQLAGPSIGRLTRPARRRLLAAALGAPRRTPLGRFPTWSLALYLSLELPARRLVVGHAPSGIGVVGRAGRGLALVVGAPRGGASAQRLLAWGDDEAERVLGRALERWRARGRPGEDDLGLRVGFDGEHSTIRHRWQV